MRWHGQRGGNVMRWHFGKGGRVVSREGGMEFKEKIVLYCSREAKCKQSSLQEFHNSYIIFWIITVARRIVA